MGGRRYNKAEIEVALEALVMAYGNCALAGRRLALAGIEIPDNTLRDWKTRHAERMEEIRIAKTPELEETQAQMAEAVQTAAGDVTLHLLERAMETADQLKPHEIPGAARNYSTVYGIGSDKTFIHRQKPTLITGHDFSHALKALERMGLVEGTAEEIADAEVVLEAGDS